MIFRLSFSFAKVRNILLCRTIKSFEQTFYLFIPYFYFQFKLQKKKERYIDVNLV